MPSRSGEEFALAPQQCGHPPFGGLLGPCFRGRGPRRRVFKSTSAIASREHDQPRISARPRPHGLQRLDHHPSTVPVGFPSKRQPSSLPLGARMHGVRSRLHDSLWVLRDLVDEGASMASVAAGSGTTPSRTPASILESRKSVLLCKLFLLVLLREVPVAVAPLSPTTPGECALRWRISPTQSRDRDPPGGLVLPEACGPHWRSSEAWLTGRDNKRFCSPDGTSTQSCQLNKSILSVLSDAALTSCSDMAIEISGHSSRTAWILNIRRMLSSSAELGWC